MYYAGSREAGVTRRGKAVGGKPTELELGCACEIIERRDWLIDISARKTFFAVERSLKNIRRKISESFPQSF